MRRLPARRFVVAFALLALATLATGAKCIEHDTMYVDSEGYTHVVGHMTNETDVSASSVTLDAKLFDASDNLIAETTGTLCPVTVQPHSSNAFDLKFPNPNIPGAVRYEVRPIAGATIAQPLPDPHIFLIRFYARRVGPDVIVFGQVRNDSGQTYFNTSLCAAVYDQKGDVIRTLDHPITGDFTPGYALIFQGAIPSTPDNAVQFRLWFTTGADTQWVMSDKVTIQ
jgi:hypothetical protein